MNILDKMNQIKDFYTKSEKKIYNVLSKNPELVQGYTITQVAGFAEVSTSAMLRFCKRLGYNGYKDFKYDLESNLSQKYKDHPSADPLMKIANTFSEAILTLPGECDEALHKLADHIKDSDKIIALGRYRNKTIAEKMFTTLTSIGITCITASDTLTYENLEKIITKDTTVIVFSVMHDMKSYQSVVSDISELTDRFWLVTCNRNNLRNLGFHHYAVLPSTGSSVPALDQHTIMFVFIEMLGYILRTTLKSLPDLNPGSDS